MSLIQREGRPALDLSPDKDDYISKDWSDPIGAAHCQEDYNDLGANDLNNPVDVRKGYPAQNGWQLVASDIEAGESPAKTGTKGNEKR